MESTKFLLINNLIDYTSDNVGKGNDMKSSTYKITDKGTVFIDGLCHHYLYKNG